MGEGGCSAAVTCSSLLTVCLATAVPWTTCGAGEDSDDPARSGGTIDEVPTASLATAPAHHVRAVFVCRDTVPVTYSDRPCGEFTELRAIRIDDPIVSGLAATVAPPSAPAVLKPRPEPRPDAAVPKNDADARCRSLHDQRDKLDQRMRAGYSAREAARLWSRSREIDARIYAARC